MVSLSNRPARLVASALILALCHCSSPFDQVAFDSDGSAPADATSPSSDGGGIYVLSDSPYLPVTTRPDAGSAADAAPDAGPPADAAAPPDAEASTPLSCSTTEFACGGACVSRNDLHNCGACGNACATQVADATPVCAGGACAFTCNSGHHLCGAGSSATCASDTSASTCGSSCAPCSAPTNSTATCTPAGGGTYACGFSCATTLLACGNGCVDAQSDLANCGGCGKTCTTAVAHAQPACSGGSCGLTCDGGFHACGTGASETCADDASTQSCGSSCTPCTAPAYATSRCDASGGSRACAWSCNAGYHACGAGSSATCADDTSPATCGSSCVSCTAPANASATCVVSSGSHACSFACNAGFSQCGSSCLDLQNDASNCGACGHSCAPGTCSAGECQPWTIAQAANTPASIASDGTYLAWFDTGGQKCQVVTVAGAAATPPQAPTTFGSGDSGSNVTLGYVAVSNGVVACLVQNNSGPEVWYGAGNATAASIQLTGNDSGNVTGLALNATGTALFFNNALTNGPSGTVNVYACNFSTRACGSAGSYAASTPGNLVIAGNTAFLAEGSNGIVGAMSLLDGTVSNVATGQGTVDVVTADSTYLYWTSGVNTTTVSRATLASLAAGPQVILPSVAALTQGLVSDGTSLYLGGAISTSPSYGWIASLPVAGASTATIITKVNSNIVYGFAVAGGVVYWGDYGDGLVRGLHL